LAQVAVDVARDGNECVASQLLRGSVFQPAPRAELAAAPSWDRARARLAAELTVNLAVAAGARAGAVTDSTRAGPPAPAEAGANKHVAALIAFAGLDAVRFALARERPGAGQAPDPTALARHVLSNPAYAVRYAHAATVAVLRWAGSPPGEFRPSLLAEPVQRALLDALSWLPERVATAARRGRPDVFARYLEVLASRTIDTMSTTGPTSEMLWLALAARTALGAGLGLLGVSAPDRL
jgi:arginyl-tRNA synthetase